MVTNTNKPETNSFQFYSRLPNGENKSGLYLEGNSYNYFKEMFALVMVSSGSGRCFHVCQCFDISFSFLPSISRERHHSWSQWRDQAGGDRWCRRLGMFYRQRQLWALLVVHSWYLVNKPLPAASISADNVRGWEIVRKMNIWPRREASRANVKFWGESLSQGHYQPIYQQAGKGFIYFINSH